MPVTGIFSFSHDVFNGFLYRIIKSHDCVVKGQTKRVVSHKLENFIGNKEMLVIAEFVKVWLFQNK